MSTLMPSTVSPPHHGPPATTASPMPCTPSRMFSLTMTKLWQCIVVVANRCGRSSGTSRMVVSTDSIGSCVMGGWSSAAGQREVVPRAEAVLVLGEFEDEFAAYGVGDVAVQPFAV